MLDSEREPTEQEQEESPIVVETEPVAEELVAEEPIEGGLVEAPPQPILAPRPITLPVIRFPPFEQADGEEEDEDDMSDLFFVPKESTDDLVAVSEEDVMGEETEEDLEDALEVPEEEDDLSDILDVSEEDVMGEAPKKRYKNTKRGRRATRYPQSPTSLGGVNY
jgi:hypothetical protein